MKKLPKFLKQYFWDIDFEKLDCTKYPKYVIEWILEHGNEKAISWMKNIFSRCDIVGALTINRELREKSANFWAVVLDVKKEKCLNRFFLETRKQFRPY